MIRRIVDPRTRTIVARLAHAIRGHLDCELGPTRAALEIACNATFLLLGEPDLDAAELLDEMIRHRVRHGWLVCGDIASTVRLGADAWLRVRPREEVAA